MALIMVVEFDVTGWTQAEVDELAAEVAAQGEASELHPHSGASVSYRCGAAPQVRDRAD